MRGLNGKVIVVAGGGSGIGAATSRRLGDEGAIVVVGDLNGDAAQAVADEIRAAGGRAANRQFDLADDASCRELIGFAVSEHGGLDGLYNVGADVSAETLGRDGDLLTTPTEVWERTIDVNLLGYVRTARSAIPALLARGGGTIVNTITGLIFYGDPKRPAYGASKGAVMVLTRHIATRWGKQGIRCNAVAPGFVITPQTDRNVSQQERNMILSINKSPRHGRPEDIAAAVAFLLSDDAEWINAQIHLVNGGR